MFKNIIKKTYDLHVHIWPESLPRKFNIETLCESEKWKLKWIAVKNHQFPTYFAKGMNKTDLEIIYSVALNRFVWWLNCSLIELLWQLCSKLIVWLPTINSTSHLKFHDYEIPPEWWLSVNPTRSEDIEPINMLWKDWRLNKDIIKVLEVIKQNPNIILATWHISKKEAKKVIDFALKIWIKNIILTHPIYSIFGYSIEEQKEIAKLWVWLEMSSAMDYIDKISIKKIVNQIKEIWPKYFIISSDCWQSFAPWPSEALNNFCIKLYNNWLSEKDIELMLLNSNKIIDL